MLVGDYETQFSYLLEVWQDTVPIPSGIRATQLSPSIVFCPCSTDRYHAVDGGASANAATKADRLSSAVDSWLWNGRYVVVDSWIVEVAASAFLNDSIGNYKKRASAQRTQVREVGPGYLTQMTVFDDQNGTYR